MGAISSPSLTMSRCSYSFLFITSQSFTIVRSVAPTKVRPGLTSLLSFPEDLWCVIVSLWPRMPQMFGRLITARILQFRESPTTSFRREQPSAHQENIQDPSCRIQLVRHAHSPNSPAPTAVPTHHQAVPRHASPISSPSSDDDNDNDIPPLIPLSPH